MEGGEDSELLTLDRLFECTFARYGDRPAIRHAGETLSYAELDERSRRFADVYAALGLTVDDRVGILMDNRPEFITAHTGAVRAGVPVVPLNKKLDDTQVRELAQTGTIDVLVVGERFFETIEAIQRERNEFQHVIAQADEEPIPVGFHDLEELLASADPVLPEPSPSPEDTAAVYYTSGTTGDPKGVVHTHRSLALNCYAHTHEMEINRGEQMLLTTPLSHSAEPFARAGLTQGATVVLQQEFDSETVLETIEREEITWTFMVPTMIAAVVEDERLSETDTDSLETIAYGAAPIPDPILKRGVEQFGRIFLQFYGLTEVPNLITVLPKSDHDPEQGALESAGYPTQLVEIRLLDIDAEWATDVGEIAVRSPYALAGYVGEQSAYTDDGWLRTGDVGRIEDGRVHVLDRIQDVIVVDGEPVFSTTVENAIQRHPDVRRVAVIGVPENGADTRRSEAVEQIVKAVVVPADDAEITPESLRDVCSDSLADSPLHSIDVVGQLPETPYGKVDKQALRDPYW
ncbi:AMP-binding protein [Halovenus sp. WSH3]|uniref:AMP-binding protein n=1 Tax=Halovenus carboxidivorans TaxID=2692199 RepID=A0A6B0TB23_9EURY|nr:AMP-binding protein [Halovenus carboxidivorans]MXR50379.1 AMP-binding protein [Halovenus carboxidivorans]